MFLIYYYGKVQSGTESINFKNSQPVKWMLGGDCLEFYIIFRRWNTLNKLTVQQLIDKFKESSLIQYVQNYVCSQCGRNKVNVMHVVHGTVIVSLSKLCRRRSQEMSEINAMNLN